MGPTQISVATLNLAGREGQALRLILASLILMVAAYADAYGSEAQYRCNVEGFYKATTKIGGRKQGHNHQDAAFHQSVAFHQARAVHNQAVAVRLKLPRSPIKISR